MAFKIEQRIIPGLPNIALTARRYVIAHEAGNPNNTGPNALENEISFMSRNFKNAFVSHWVGGGGRIVQLAPVGRYQYGAGPKANPYSYAHVELARTTNKAQFKKDYEAYIWILRKLARDAGLPVRLDGSGNGIKSHEWVSKNLGGTTHVDPFGYLASMGITRAQFAKDIANGIATTAAPATKPAAPSTSGTYKVVKSIRGYTTAANAKAKKDPKSTVKKGTYYVFNRSGGMINVSTKKGVPGSWINPADNKVAENKTYHVVAKGDTAYSLTRRYGCTLAQLRSWNKLDSKYTLRLGRKIRVK